MLFQGDIRLGQFLGGALRLGQARGPDTAATCPIFPMSHIFFTLFFHEKGRGQGGGESGIFLQELPWAELQKCS